MPRADGQVQLLRQSAIKEAQFGQLDAGRFRGFSGGDAVFYAERVDHEGVLHNVFVQRESAGRIEVALADTATYSKPTTGGTHLVTLFNGERYEGVPGTDDFRIIEFREHGIPIATPEDVHEIAGSGYQTDTPAVGLEQPLRYRPIAIQGLDAAHGAGAHLGGRTLK